jgi:hypothetical protein
MPRPAWGPAYRTRPAPWATIFGQDVEIHAHWHWGTHMSFDVGYDHFFKGSYTRTLAQIPGNPSSKDSDYFYIRSEFRF